MRDVFGILFLVLGLGCAYGCTDGGKKRSISCLATFFSKTSQRVPPDLEMLINQATGTGSGGKANEGNSYAQLEEDLEDEGYHEGQGLKTEWCGPFHDFRKCLSDAKDACPGASVYACVMTSIFAATYGDKICNMDTSSWVKHDPLSECKKATVSSSEEGATPVSNFTLLVGLFIVLFLQLLKS